MNNFTYEVVKETPGYHIDSYSDTEKVEVFNNPSDALKMRDKLRESAGDGEWYYVDVTWGSVDNV